MGKDKSKTHHFMMDKKKKTVTESLGKIVQAVLKDDSLMFMLSKYKTASPSLSLQDFSNDLSKVSYKKGVIFTTATIEIGGDC